MFDYIRKLFEMLLKNYQQLVETNRDVFGNAYGWMMRGLGSLLTWLGESGLQLLAVVGYVLLVAAAVISSIYTLLLVLGVIFVVARAEESIFKYLWSIKVRWRFRSKQPSPAWSPSLNVMGLIFSTRLAARRARKDAEAELKAEGA